MLVTIVHALPAVLLLHSADVISLAAQQVTEVVVVTKTIQVVNLGPESPVPANEYTKTPTLTTSLISLASQHYLA